MSDNKNNKPANNNEKPTGKGTSAEMSAVESYSFDPNIARNEGLFNNFANSAFGADVVKQMEETPMGRRLIDFARRINPIIAFEEMPLYSLYVPADHNLDAARLNGEGFIRSDKPVLLMDSKDLDQTILPYILAAQLFRLMQDCADPEGSLIIPMFQNSIVYNPIGRVDYENVFTRDFIDMERACDVVALITCYQMSHMGNSKAFGLMRAQPHMEDICQWIAQTAAFIEKTGMGNHDAQMAEDVLIYMANLTAFQSPEYIETLRTQAKAAYDSTMSNPGFALLAQQQHSSNEIENWNGEWDDDWDDDDWDAESALDEFDEEWNAFLLSQGVENEEDLTDEEWDALFEKYSAEIDGFDGDPEDIVHMMNNAATHYSPPMHNGAHYALLTDSYQDRKWDPAVWIEAVTVFIEEEKKDRAFRISEAFKVAANAQAEREKNDYLNGKDDDASAPTSKNDPKTPKQDEDKPYPVFKTSRNKKPNGPR